MTTLDLNKKSDFNETIAALDNYNIICVRYTFDEDEDTPETREAITLNILRNVETNCVVQFYTTGYETNKTKYPHTGLPSKPHIHVHMTVQCAKYDFEQEKDRTNFKASIRRKIQTSRSATGIPWGKNKLYIKFELDPENPKDLFEYPLKQANKWQIKDQTRGFYPTEISEMKLKATTKYDLIKSQSETARQRIDSEGMSEFYRQLQNHLALSISHDMEEILNKIYDFFCLKSKPIRPDTIEGYALLHAFQNNIISQKEFIKKKHKHLI